MTPRAERISTDLVATVLLVDDDPLTATMLAQFLRGMGCMVDSAEDGEEAVKKVAQTQFDLVLLDLVLPGMSGSETFEIIKGFDEDIPIIISTAYGSLENAIEFLKNGAADYLPKPIHFEEFKFRVNRALEERRLKEQAVTDIKTQLFNHDYFVKRLEEELGRARRYGHDLSLVMLDLDNFKEYNDNFGHLAGDKVLIQVGAILKEVIRDCDIPCRFGGEEFTIILPVTDANGAMRVAERVRESIEKSLFNNDSQTSITASIGVSSFNPEKPFGANLNMNVLIEVADQALYQAKKTGKNAVQFLEAPALSVQRG
jgi:diguanylate cyclase (GGDEF)-like protein